MTPCSSNRMCALSLRMLQPTLRAITFCAQVPTQMRVLHRNRWGGDSTIHACRSVWPYKQRPVAPLRAALQRVCRPQGSLVREWGRVCVLQCCEMAPVSLITFCFEGGCVECSWLSHSSGSRAAGCICRWFFKAAFVCTSYDTTTSILALDLWALTT